jgi:hypothetical protein
MAEYEELRLTVTLVDNASSSLRQLQQTMKETATGPTSQHMENFAKKGNILKDAIKAMGLEARGTTAMLEGMGTKLLGVGGSVATLVTAIVVATERVGKLATSFNEASRSWEAMGTTLAHGKNISEQLARIGIDEQKSMELVGNAIQQHVVAQKRGLNEQFRELRMRFGEQFEEEYKRAIAVAKTPEQYLNAAADAEKKVGEIVEKNLRGQSREEIDAQKAYAQQRFRTITGFNEELHLVTQLRELDKEREQFWDKMDENAKKIAEDWRGTWENINQIWELLKSDLFDPDKSPFPAMMHAAKASTDAFFAAILKGQELLQGHNFWQDFFKFITPTPFNAFNPAAGASNLLIEQFRKHSEQLNSMQPTIPGGIPGGGAVPFAALPGADDMDDNTRELKRLNDQLYEVLHPPETSGGVGAESGSSALRGGGGVEGGAPGPNSPSITPGPRTSNESLNEPPGPKAPNVTPRAPNLATPEFSGWAGANRGPFDPTGKASIVGSGTMDLLSGPTKGAEPFVPSGKGGGIGAGGSDDLHPNAQGFLAAIREHEAKDWKEAYSDATNIKSYGHTYGKNYDYGHYQMNYNDVADLEAKGVPHSTAVGIRGGEGRLAWPAKGQPDVNAPNRISSEQQHIAVNEYLQKTYPSAYKKLLEGGPNAFETMRAATHHPGRRGESWKWFGLRDDPAGTKAAYERVRNEANERFRGAAAGVAGGGGMPGGGGATSDAFDVKKTRSTIDSVAGQNAKQRVEAAGHLRVEIPGFGGGGSASASQLFNKTPMNRQTQMQPATSGPAEPAVQGGLNPPSH